MKTIKRIVFTGGPCSGKTTFTSRAQSVFSDRGYRVIIDHESATDLISGGISPATMGMYDFQKYCIDLQLKKEELCYKAAQEIEGEKVLIFIDRGILDDMAYVGEEDFRKILKDFNMVPEELNDRYDMVIHLVTAAKGKEEAYTLANNAARYETIEEARTMDDMALMSWKNHPNRVIIDNETEFEVKMIKAIQSVFEYLDSNNEPVEKFNRYLVEVNDDVLNRMKEETSYSKSHIVQYYLLSDNGYERRIRAKEKNGETMYSYAEANYLSTNERVKVDRVLTERQYKDYFHQIDPEFNVIDKNRYSFMYKNLFFKLEVFDFDTSKGILTVDQPSDGRQVEIPDYINVLKDVSDDLNYKNYYLAKSQKF
ncbi:MAG: AAA family ATPase [Erysipelotrichaceae bacterium]|nr:AAA family ATPase [Erysipelotrichaceae bacterium]MBQ4019533.1 AAA family ATPase [Erysipelotrichaceae bacterium]